MAVRNFIATDASLSQSLLFINAHLHWEISYHFITGGKKLKSAEKQMDGFQRFPSLMERSRGREVRGLSKEY